MTRAASTRPPDLGPWIAELRRHAGLTQADLGSLVGVVRQTIAAWERAERAPNVAQCQRIAQALHVSLVTILEPATELHGWKVRQCG